MIKETVMDYLEIFLWLLSIVLSSILGWFTNWHFFRKQRKEGKSAMEILEQLRQHDDAVVRLGNDKRGKIIKNENGTYGIAWTLARSESVSVGAEPKVEVEKGA
jgi:preprotein translocase subunit YajC